MGEGTTVLCVIGLSDAGIFSTLLPIDICLFVDALQTFVHLQLRIKHLNGVTCDRQRALHKTCVQYRYATYNVTTSSPLNGISHGGNSYFISIAHRACHIRSLTWLHFETLYLVHPPPTPTAADTNINPSAIMKISVELTAVHLLTPPQPPQQPPTTAKHKMSE